MSDCSASSKDQGEELLCIFFPDRSTYQAGRNRGRECLGCLVVFETYTQAKLFISALEKPGATIKPMLRGELVSLCKKRGVEALMVIEDPRHTRYEFIL
jgi:hypothetical protein